MTESPQGRWIIRGTGHWLMIAAVWGLAFLAGDRFMQAVRGETSWLVGISIIPVSIISGIAALRTKRTKD